MWRGLMMGVLACVTAAPALAQAPLLVREGGFEHAPQSFEWQLYPYSDGAFFAYEVTPPDLLWKPNALPERRPQSVIAIDALTGETRAVTQPLMKPLNMQLALKDHLISVGGDYNRVSVIRRADGAILGERRLYQRVQDALVEGDTLYLLQDDSLARFRLPGMVFLGETPVPDAYRFPRSRLVDGKVVSVRADKIEVMSLSGGALSSIPIAQPCAPSIHDPGYESAVGGRYIVARTGCRHVTVFDIREGRRVFDLPDYPEAEALDIAIGDRFLFARRKRQDSPTPVSVFDLTSGRELGRVALPPGGLIALRDRLLVWTVDELVVPGAKPPRGRVEADQVAMRTLNRRLTVSVYRPDPARLLDPARADADLRAAITAARAADNPYRAIDLLESASPYPMQQALDSGQAEPWREAAVAYARMLSLSQTRAAKGVTILERLSSLYPDDANIKADLQAARRRAAILDVDPAVREPVLAPLWAKAEKRPLLTSRTAAQSVSGDLDWKVAHFHDNHIFVPCRNCPDKGAAGIQVFDRKTSRPVALLPAPIHGFGSIEINSIAFAGGRMFAGLNASAGSDEPNVLAFDLASMTPVKAWNAFEIGPDSSSFIFLVVRGDVVGVYDCSDPASGKGFAAKTLAEAPAPLTHFEACDYQLWAVPGIAPGLAPGMAARAAALNAHISMVGRKYLVGAQGNRWIRIENKLFLREGDTQGIALPRPLAEEDRTPVIAFTADESLAITPSVGPEDTFFTAFDIATQRDTTLIDIRAPMYPRSHMAGDGRTLFAGLGSSLLAIDMRTGDVLDFADVLTAPQGGSRAGKYPITAVKVDGDKLVVGSAAAVAMFDLNKFYAAAEAEKTPFAETRRVLMRQ